MSAAAANLTPYHTLPLLPSNLAVANLSIETLSVKLFLIITVAPQPRYVLASQTWVRRAPPSCCRTHGERSTLILFIGALPSPNTVIAGSAVRARRERTAVTPSDDEDEDEDEEGVTTVLDTPPRPIALAIRSPEAPPPPELMTVSRSFPEGPSVPPASTAPPRLADDEGCPKRKRAPTRGRYKDAVAQGKVSKPYRSSTPRISIPGLAPAR